MLNRNMVRGGQTTMHSFRMLKQILKVTVLTALLFTIIFFSGIYTYKYHIIFHSGDISTLWDYIHVLIYTSFSYQGGKVHVYNGDVIRILKHSSEYIIPLLEESFVFFICSCCVILGYFKYMANRRFHDTLLHGFNLVTPKILTKLVNKYNDIEEKRIIKAIKKRNKQRIKKQDKLYDLSLKYLEYKKNLRLNMNIAQYVWDREKARNNQYLNERSNLCDHRLFMIKFKKFFASKNRKLLLDRGILLSDYIRVVKQIKTLKKDLLLNKIPLELECVREKYTLGGIPMPIGSENTHILSIGTTGTGKTVSMNGVIATIKNHKGKAVIYDKMGTFVEKFYNPKTDIILNPFDMRSPAWSIFKEVEKNTDWDMIAEAMISQSGETGDPFWVNAARTLLSSTGQALQEKGVLNTSTLVDNLLKVDLGTLAQMVKNLPAASIISSEDKENKTALSVRAILATNLACLQYLKEDQKTWINLREWIRNDNISGILFFTSRGDIHSSIQGLITMWLEILINTLLSLPKKESRKIWFILDELPSLKKIPSLESALAESRQYGGAFFLATQTWSQMESTYGQKSASSIAGVTRSRLILGSSDEVSAKWSSDNIGEIIKNVHQEHISYGANSNRDGVSNSEQERKEKLVTSTEIRQLRNLEGYIIYPNGLPPAKIMQKYVSYRSLTKSFMPVSDFFINKGKLMSTVSKAKEQASILGNEKSDMVDMVDETQSIYNEDNSKEEKSKEDTVVSMIVEDENLISDHDVFDDSDHNDPSNNDPNTNNHPTHDMNFNNLM